MTLDPDGTNVRSWRILGVRDGMALLARAPSHEAPTAQHAVILPIDHDGPSQCVIAAEALATVHWHRPSPLLYTRLTALILRAERALPRTSSAGEGRVENTDSDAEFHAVFTPETTRIPSTQLAAHRDALLARGVSASVARIAFPAMDTQHYLSALPSAIQDGNKPGNCADQSG